MNFKGAVAVLATMASWSGCTSDYSDNKKEEIREIVSNLIQTGFPDEDIAVISDVVYVGNDAAVNLQASREMLRNDRSNTKHEQYRTNNLVSSNVKTICVNGAQITGVLSTGLDRAIANYNAQKLTFSMQRTSGGTAGCSAVITIQIGGPLGGSSGFPFGGLPFNTINIGSADATLPVGTITHIITHELGHCIGFRHSDFFDRSISCNGSAVNEGDAGVGANLISGTPSGATVGGSIMNSCFRTNEIGSFTASDITAIQALY
jgi:hypothetical protein